MKILFVCSSNVCRSAYCEYMFRRMVQQSPVLCDKGIEVRSGAVVNISREIFHQTVPSLVREGFSNEEVLAHKPCFKWLDMQRFKDADVIIGMTKSHKFFTPIGCKKKFMTLSEAAIGKYVAIPDPFLKNDEDFQKCMDVLKGYMRQYLAVLEKQYGGTPSTTERQG